VRSSSRRSCALFGTIGGLTCLLDVVTKYLVRSHAPPLAFRPLRVFGDWLYITCVQNTGAAWSCFQGHNRLLAALGIVALAVIFWQRPRTVEARPIRYALLSGGILGNLLERLHHGHVTDFIDVHLPFYRWPSFNIADSAICVAVGLLLLTPSPIASSRSQP